LAERVRQVDAPVLAGLRLVRGAGGVVSRSLPGGAVEIALVHRPGYDDWTLPKGKLDPGEIEEYTAVREIEEETGLRCRLERWLGTTRYLDHKGRRKVVHYWLMRPLSGFFAPNKEVDELRWVAPHKAADLMTYEHDRALLGRLDGRMELPHQPHLRAVYLVRHAKAGDREEWEGPDEMRPLTKSGLKQADVLAERLAAFSITRILSSPHVRCLETVEPIARRLGLRVVLSDALAEGSDPAAARQLIDEAAQSSTVLCSHGDIIAGVMEHFAEAGVVLEGEPRWEKGSVWALETDGSRVHAARSIPAP
jgi:8-oxo-(d)GTP phosphatase